MGNDRFALGDQAFAKVLERRPFPADAVIFNEGDAAREAFVILRGEVDIVSVNKNKQRIVLTTLGKGQLFGDLALMAESRRTATAVARTPCELIAISQEVLERKLEAADPLLRFWITYLGGRVIALSKRATS